VAVFFFLHAEVITLALQLFVTALVSILIDCFVLAAISSVSFIGGVPAPAAL